MTKKELLWATIARGLREIFFILLFPLDLIIPKRNDYWLFSMRKDVPWGDNLRCVFDRAVCGKEITPILLYCDDNVLPMLQSLYKGTRAKFKHKRSLAGLWYFYRSKVCFTSNSNFRFYSVITATWLHHVVNLWHGIPIKTIGIARPMWKKVFNLFFPPQFKANTWIASSDIDRLAMAFCMTKDRDLEQVWTTGLPRNDLLLSENLPPDLRAEEEKLIKLKNGRKLLLYAPTWRGWKTCNPFFDENFLPEFIKMLNENGFVLGIRKHPFDTSLPDNAECISLNGDIVANTQILLRNTDVLLTDYSSIFVDYLLLNRPIIGFCYDFDKYENDQSFLYDFKEIFPGQITQNKGQLLDAVGHTIKGQDAGKAEREACTKILFKYRDANSTERVYQKTIEIIKL